MKKTLVATTAARGTAVSSSKITAVQSVYIGCGGLSKPLFQQVSCALPCAAINWASNSCRPMQPPSRLARLRPASPLGINLLLGLLLALLLAEAPPGFAGVRFENCVTAADGSISCDTVPTGNTLAQDEEARFGLLDNASPGWSEFDPFGGYEDDFGGNQT